MMGPSDQHPRASIEELIQGSSLGTEGARKIRERTPPAQAELTRQIARLRSAIDRQGELNDWFKLGVLLEDHRRFLAAAQLYRLLGAASLYRLASVCTRTGDHDKARLWTERAKSIARAGDDYPPVSNIRIKLADGQRDNHAHSAAQYRWIGYTALCRLSEVCSQAGVEQEAKLWWDRAQVISPNNRRDPG
jgi:tetratricopeptide (TPR) repeat protein